MDFRQMCIELRNALLETEKWWEHARIIGKANALLMEPEENTPLKWLNLPTRIQNPLLRSGCNTIEHLSRLRADQITSIRGIGDGSVQVIEDALRNWFNNCAISKKAGEDAR